MSTSELAEDVERIIQLAESNGWKLKARDKAPKTLEFFRPETDASPTKMLIFYSTGRVATTVNHPKTGRNQLYRTDVGWHVLEKLFKYPRLHTGHGYRVRKRRQEKSI